MRRTLVVVLVGLLAVSLAPAGADPQWEPTTGGGWISGPLTHLTTIVDEAGTAMDAVVHDGYLYMTSWRSFSIYDIRDPREPQLLANEALTTGIFGEEPQTNGEILLLSRDFQFPNPGVLDIYDVSDKTNPTLTGTYTTPPGAQDHLWTCVQDCEFAYSATGTILDLRAPSQPAEVGSWRDVANYRSWHHIAEVAPGLVLTGTVPMFVLDTTDPAAPQQLARIEVPVTVPRLTVSANQSALPARVAWPRDAEDRYAIVSMETPFNGSCHEPTTDGSLTNESGEVLTFDTTGWREAKTFSHLDRYQLEGNGAYIDGNAPYNVIGCSAYGMDTHPAWDDAGRLAAVVFFEHGVRLLAVGDEGGLSEVGGFIPLAGNASAVRWVADDVVYVIDLHRGIDVLEVDLDALG